MDNKDLLKLKEECCGCSACVNVCPKDALIMAHDEYGFCYPVKDTEKCIGCDLCLRVCNFGRRDNCEDTVAKKAYAVISKDYEQSKGSSSGGFFAKLAETIIRDNGYVCGASWDYELNNTLARHIIINSLEDIKLLQGSKYVQSEMGNCYADIMRLLKEGNTVLFSGTPCQVDGLKGFLRKDYDNLITLDIVCHGVPNNRILADYLNLHWKDQEIKHLSFRDKGMGWGMTGHVITTSENGKSKMQYITPKNSSYFSAFLKGEIYRDNCYKCPYTGENRPADITIGDFWGLNIEHPEFVRNQNQAVSAVILNSARGNAIFDRIKSQLCYCKSEFEKIAKHNSQLRHPSICPDERQKILDGYRDGGYNTIEKYFIKSTGRFKIINENIKLRLKSIRNSFR